MIDFSEFENYWWSWSQNQHGRNSRLNWKRRICLLWAFQTWV